MSRFLRTMRLALLLACGSVFAAQVSIGIRIGPPPPPRVVRVLPPRPGPEFIWIEGYWYPVGSHYKWHAGYWTRPFYPGARWVVPHHEGERGRIEHDHRWDRDRDRDFREEHHDR
jgi:hypothetical protein